MSRILNPVIGSLLLLGTLGTAQIAAANPIASRSPSKSELIKSCMVKNMSARRDLHYNDAAKECSTQVELQSNVATAAPLPAKS